HYDEVYSVAFGPEGQALSGSVDQTMRLWDLNTGKNTQVFRGHLSHVREVAYSARAKLVVTCSLYGPIHLWNLETGKEVRRIADLGFFRFTKDLSGFTSVCFSPDGKRLVSAAGHKMLHIWDVETGKELKRIDAPNRE